MAAGSMRSASALRLVPATLRLAARFFPQLAFLWIAGKLAEGVLTELALRIGLLNRLAGLTALTLVVLVKLVVIVALFETVRPALPALQTAARGAEERGAATADPAPGTRFAEGLALILIPFFAYYAAWGFLSDTIRDYSRAWLDLVFAGVETNGTIADVGAGAWLVASVLLAWLVRRFAKAMRTRSAAAVWPFLVVVCEANWVFIGLFVLGRWKDEAAAVVDRLVGHAADLLSALTGIASASAAAAIPATVEAAPPSLAATAEDLFFYALYPIVWLTLAALVYGYDIDGAPAVEGARLRRAVEGWSRVPKAVRDFVGHFVAGTAKRYRALANGVGMTLATGLPLALAVVVLYRLLDWGAAWAWLGVARFVIGPHDFLVWQLVANALSLFLGTPSAPGEGILVTPVKICLLAAAIDLSFAAGRRFRRGSV